MANINDIDDNSLVSERASSRDGIMSAMDQLIPEAGRSIEPQISSSPEPETSHETTSEDLSSDSSQESSSVEDPINNQAPKEEKIELPKTSTKSNKPSLKTSESPKLSKTLATNTTSQVQQIPSLQQAEQERPYDEEIDGVKAPLGVNPQALKQLRTIASKYKGEANALRPQLTQLQTQINQLNQQTGKLPPEVEHELKELKAHRVLYDIQNDPTFKAAYDDKISLTENQIYDHLRSLPNPLPEQTIEYIKSKGGLFNCPNPDNPNELLLDSQFWRDEIRGKMPLSHVVKHEELIKSGILLKDAKQQTVQQIKQNREQYEKDRETYVQKVQQNERQTTQNIVSQFREKIPWTRVQDVPVDATPELRAAIEEDNKFVPELEKHFEEAYQAFDQRNIQKRTEIAATYALAHKQAQMLATGQRTLQQHQARISEQDTEINRLNSEIQKMRNAGKTKSSTPVSTPAGKPKSAPEEEYMGMNTRQALTARLG